MTETEQPHSGRVTERVMHAVKDSVNLALILVNI